MSGKAIEALRELSDAATPGPWAHAEDHGRDVTDEGWSSIRVQAGLETVAFTWEPGYEDNDRCEADAAFIAAAANYVRAALAEPTP